jgi:hypothetical protein
MERCKLYDLFLKNTMHQHKYKVILKNREAIIGIPIATGSIVDPTDDNAWFTINNEKINFSEVTGVEKIE